MKITYRRHTGQLRVKALTGCRMLLLALGAGTSLPALAQQGIPTPAVEAGAEEDGAEDDAAIFVTATKREERLQDVPLTITAITGENMKALGMTDAFSIASQTPNMYVDTNVGSRTSPRFNIRGAGTNDFSAAATTSVGVYQDEVFINNNLAQGTPLFDLQRIEVLRGPQGTLWGKNTTAGTVNFISNAPTRELDGYARATYGNFNRLEFEGAVGGPIIGDTLRGRIAFFTSHRDGAFFNTLRNERVGEYDDTAVRAQLQWLPVDTFDIRALVSHRTLKETMVVHHQGITASGADFAGYIESPNSRVMAFNQPAPLSFEQTSATVRANLETGIGTLTSISGYIDVEQVRRADGDASPSPALNSHIATNLKQYSQELRLASPSSQRLRWIVGAHYLNEALFNITTTHLALTPAFDSFRTIDQDTRSWAGFGSLEFDITPALTAHLGGRYSSEKKSILLINRRYTPDPTDPLNAYQGVPGLILATQDQSVTTNRFTWDVSLDYKFAPGKMVYARVAKGFKAAAFNGSVAVPADISVARPEGIIDYEVGLKSTWLDNAVQLNLAAYYYDYTDYQITIITQGVNTRFANAERARIKGLEAELTLRPTDFMLLSLTGGLNDAKFTEFPAAVAPAQVNQGLPFDAAGQRLPRSPAKTATFLARYTIPMESGDLTLQTDWTYTGEINYDVWVDATNLTPNATFTPLLPAMRDALEEESYILGNARVAYSFGAERNAELSVWVRNIANKYYQTNRYPLFAFGSAPYFRGDLRTYGATFEVKF